MANRNFGSIKEPDIEIGGEYYPFTKQEVQNGQQKTGSNKEPINSSNRDW